MRIEQIGRARLYLGDCSQILPTLSEQERARIMADPPYGIDFAAQPTTGQRKAGQERETWDSETVPFVNELPGLGREVIIWGGNYYPLPPSRGWLCWHKPDSPPSMADFELAWTSYDMNAKLKSVSIASTNAERCGHPTLKPVRLMRWTLDFMTQGLVCDPFMGSGSTGVAAIQSGRDFIGIEKNPKYFDLACRRIAELQNVSGFADAMKNQSELFL